MKIRETGLKGCLVLEPSVFDDGRGYFFESFNQKTFEEKIGIHISFVHGFSVLEDNTIFSYKCDNYYHKASEGGIMYNDSQLNIDWKLDENEVMLSEKDKVLPIFKNLHIPNKF